MIEIRLHFRQLLLGLLQTRALFIGGPDGAPDIIQVALHIHEKVRAPAFAAKALFSIVMPVLGRGAACQSRRDRACCKDSLHDYPPTAIIAESIIVI